MLSSGRSRAGYVLKPIPPGLNRDEILRATKRNSKLAVQVMQNPNQNTAGLAFNFAELLERIENDAELLRELLVIFKRDYPRRLRSLKKAITGAEMNQVETTSHSLRGMFSNLAMDRAAAAAAHLEQMGRNRARVGLEDALAHLEQEVAHVLSALDAYMGEQRR